MKSSDFVLYLVHASGGNIQGRTLLQKRSFFVGELCHIDLGFDAHYYGPYSAEVDNAVGELKSLGFIDEANIGFGVARGGFEMKRYDYRLTHDGTEVVEFLKRSHAEDYKSISQSVQRIADAGNPDYVELSIAAKAYFILTKRRKPMSRAELVREAQKFDWIIDAVSLDRAVTFLEQLGLAKSNH
jgi:uncharacterized protein YwgA